VIKAEIVELNPRSGRPMPNTRLEVQFNPETLHVSYARPPGDDPSGGTTRLRMELWFDVSDQPDGNVRRSTIRLAALMRARSRVRFSWGTFQFDGTPESLDEMLEFFSADGRPLRAHVALGLCSDDIQLCDAGSSA
jgi:hypothetical protein